MKATRIFGSVWPKKPDDTIERRIAEVYKVLNESADMRVFAEGEVWPKMRAVFETEMALVQEQIVLHCQEPDKHKEALSRLWAYQHAFGTFIDIIEAPSKAHEGILKKLTQLIRIRKATTGLPRPSEETTRVPTAI